MGFRKPQEYVDALKELEGLPLMGVEVWNYSLLFISLFDCVELPLRKETDWGYSVVRYGMNKLDALVSRVEYDDRIEQVRLFDEDGGVIAYVELMEHKNATREDWLLGELRGENLHSSMNIELCRGYVLLITGVAFTAEVDGLTGVFVNWLAVDSPVERVIDWKNKIDIETAAGHAVTLLFKGDIQSKSIQTEQKGAVI